MSERCEIGNEGENAAGSGQTAPCHERDFTFERRRACNCAVTYAVLRKSGLTAGGSFSSTGSPTTTSRHLPLPCGMVMLTPGAPVVASGNARVSRCLDCSRTVPERQRLSMAVPKRNCLKDPVISGGPTPLRCQCGAIGGSDPEDLLRPSRFLQCRFCRRSGLLRPR